MKRFFSSLLILVMLLTSSLYGFADGPIVGESMSKDEGRYILSNPVPLDVTEYAKEWFENVDISWAEDMGLGDKVSELKLGSGFDILSYDTGLAVEIYYFPVMYHEKIEGFFAIIPNNGKYDVQSGYVYLAKPLNQMDLSSDNPVRLVASEDAIYAVDTKNEVTVLYEEILADKERMQEQVKVLLESPNWLKESETVNLTKIVAESFNLKDSISQIEERASSKKLSVAKLKNRSVGGRGVCWAATAASCIDYYEDGVADTSYAEQLMDDLIEDRQNNNNGSTESGTIEVKEYIKQYCPDLSVSSTNKISYDETKSYINAHHPMYTSWSNTSNDAGHAIVLCGYRMDSGKQQMYLMDPNFTEGYQTCTFGENYKTPNGSSYRWKRTITVE